MSDLSLEGIFSQCDPEGKGFIGPDQFQDLCSQFDIAQEDSDVIFADLDHDGDGKINFEDFSFGFRDFLVPGSRRGSIQMSLFPVRGLPRGNTLEVLDEEEIQREMEEKHERAREAWQLFADNMGKDNTRKFLSMSGDKIMNIFDELKGSNAPAHIIEGFEDALSSLLKDVKKIEIDQQQLEDQFNRERENHSAHLASIEAELDLQVAKVEAAAIEKAKNDFDAEKRALQEKMELEINELQSHLKLFQKVDTWMNKEDQVDTEAKKKLDDATQENRELKKLVGEAQTNLAILKSEMSQLKNQYEHKVGELTSEKESMMEYVYQYDNLQKQLQLLHDANRKLQDTNDHMMEMVDVQRSPRLDQRGHLAHELGYINSSEVLDPDDKSEERAFRISTFLNDIDSGLSTLQGEEEGEDGSRVFTSTDLDGRRTAMDLIHEEGFEDGLVPDLKNSPHSSPLNSIHSFTRQGPLVTPPGSLHSLPRLSAHSSPYQDRSGFKTSADSISRKSSQKSQGFNRNSSKRSLVPPLSGIGEKLSREISFDHNNYQPSYTFPYSSASMIDHEPALYDEISGPRNLEPTGPPDRTYKVVFAGDAAVGKTSFINRITKGVFLSNLSSTLGVDFQVKTIRVDERNIAIQLWDTAGQERFRSVTKTYFRRADGVMLLYDVTSERSFTSVRNWVQNVDEVSQKRIPIILCGNKTDQRETALGDRRRCISKDEGEKMARDHGALFMETSSKDGLNVLDSIVLLAREMCSSEDVEVQSSALKLREMETKSNCCSTQKKSALR